jgi:hypothetical protein
MPQYVLGEKILLICGVTKVIWFVSIIIPKAHQNIDNCRPNVFLDSLYRR